MLDREGGEMASHPRIQTLPTSSLQARANTGYEQTFMWSCLNSLCTGN